MKKYSLFIIGFAIIAGSIFIAHNNTKSYYKSDNDFMSTKELNTMQGLQMLFNMKANQNTGLIDIAAVNAARDQVRQAQLNKASFPLVWEESGPDNVGGRCRTILIDRNNPNTLYAAGVSGGIFKSTNGAGSWVAINDAMSTLAFQSSCQTVDGTIYFGSGENAGSFGGDGDKEGSVFPGEGIFKSTDGNTFTQIDITKSFTLVNAMAAHPTANIAYAGTNTNLKYTDDGGASWKNVFNGSCRDVKIASNGTVMAYMGAKIYRSTNGTDNTSYKAVNGIATGFNRMVIAISPQDPNYVYVLASRANNFGGLYQSTDGGENFTEIVPGGSSIFNPLNQGAGGQGDYDLVVAVHPRDKKKVFMGGVVMAQWTESRGPEIVFNGTHSDHHWFAFDTVSTPMRMYNGNDGGVYRSRNDNFNSFAAYNIGFNVTQFYGIAGSIDGDILGGTQDNGSLYISKAGTEKMRAIEVYGGDGFRAEISERDHSAFILTSYYGNIAKSNNKGASSGTILDKRVPRYKRGANGALELDPKGLYIKAPFNTAIKMIEAQDSISRLMVGADGEVWMVDHLFHVSKSPSWFKVANITNSFVIEATSDGKHAFVGKNGNLYRINFPLDTNNNLVYFDTLNNLDPAVIYPGVTTDQIYAGLPNGRYITGISVDRSNGNNVIVTFGNYNNTAYVYYSQNALSAVPTWKSVQGNLPAMPVYDAEFVFDNSNMVVIGTEFGIYGTTNINAGSVSWTAQNTGVSASKPFPNVAVFELRQYDNHPGDIGSLILAGTHGRGIFETKSLYEPSSVKSYTTAEPIKLHVFPNPVQTYANVQYSIKQNDNITLKVIDLTGKVVYSQELGNVNKGSKSLKIDTNNFMNGTYILSIVGTHHKGASKIIVQK